MDFNWNEPKPIDDKVFSPDNLGRAKYATYLTSLIKAKGGTDKNNLSNYVLNLDAEWGAGKTYFLKRWSEDLKGNHPVVYIDAWAIDYLESPLMTVLSEIIEQLKTQTDKIDPDETQRKLNGVIKAAAPRIGSALMKRYLGFDFNIFDSTETNEGQLTGSGKEVDFSKAGEKVLEVFCKEVTDSKESVKTLKLAIQSWVEYVVEHPVNNMNTIKNSYPAFIFIDELDRCKPTYAVEMLEAIKHVFDIPGLVFIVATNTQQLSHTVKSVYGSGFNAEEYLSRFFDNKYYLRANVTEDLLLNNFLSKSLTPELVQERGVILFPYINFELPAFFKLCADIFNSLRIAPRQAIKVLNRIELILSIVNRDTTLDIPFLVVLVALMEKNHSQYEQFIEWVNSNSSLIPVNEMSGAVQAVVSEFNKVKVEVRIESGKDRLLYPRVGNTQVEYESSNSINNVNNVMVKEELSLNSYLEIYLGSIAKSKEEFSTKFSSIKNDLEAQVEHAHERLSRGDPTKELRKQLTNQVNTKRLNLMFYVFRNTLDLKFYQELVEMSANLD
ncbi:KAP family NTPase [Pseudoalteromonas sp. 2CM39R]|uniref:KAP family P-loop NTPase fold protein n=1 Tax=Pseudoalteromonas sp. 2CM39R TaxID=2929856 RepID=UPI0020C16C54|nr:P-loop NTPase fold protein [Pseudoalteromonas sp. 2CM39R]MCK8129925.1 KAP family NTPase [Pseudoalteromonas sp. 2CM39R]